MIDAAVISTRRTARTRRPELVLAPGPLVMGQPGAGTYHELYGAHWALYWDKRRGVILQQEQAGTWGDVLPGEPFPVLNPSADRHLTLCFDQAARHVFAWEQAGQVRVRQWNPAAGRYVYQGPWPGVDPVLMADPPNGTPLSLSDTVLLYLSPDRLRLCARVQRDLYGTEYTLSTLAAPGHLDQVVTLPWQFEALGTDEQGTPWALLSDLYPVYVQAQAAGQASGPQGGTLTREVYTFRGADSVGGAASGPLGGLSFAAVLLRDLGSQGATGTASGPLGGVSVAAVLLRDLGSQGATGAASGSLGGTYPLVVITHNLTADAVRGAASGPLGGSYV